MEGRRLPDGYHPDAEPGDYWREPFGPPDAPRRFDWTVCVPTGACGSLRDHTVTEHDDGTITVSPSINLDFGPVARRWHGWLERGVFRSV